MNTEIARRDKAGAVPAGQKIILWAEDAALGEALAEQLKTRFSLEISEELPQLEQIRTAPAPLVLLLSLAPAEYLCQALLRGEAPEAALAQWETQVRAILTLQRRNRRSVQILDAKMIRHNGAACLDHYGLLAPARAVERMSAAAPVDEVLYMLAQTSLFADIRTRSLVGEFHAAAVTFGEQSGQTMSSASVLQAYMKQQQDLQGLELLQAQQRSMYEQTETLYGEKLQAEQRLEQVRQGMDSFQAQAEALQVELDRLRRRLAAKEEILNSTGTLMRDLEDINLHRMRERQRQVEDGQKQDHEIAVLKGELSRILGSRSFRMMAPLRRLRSTLRRRG